MKVCVFTLCILLFSDFSLASAGPVSPPIPGTETSRSSSNIDRSRTQSPAHPGAVRAVVVRSWGAPVATAPLWEHLNQNWRLYGPIPVYIDHTTLNHAPFITLADLQQSGADVIVLSDPAGGNMTWTQNEAEALRTYAEEGHDLIGTYLSFYWSPDPTRVTDNRGLAALWGIRTDLEYYMYPPSAAPDAAVVSRGICVFRDITDPLQMGGYPWVQVPTDLSWDANDLAGATFLARSADGRNVITEFNARTYRALFVSYMPEYQAGTDAESTQLVYNMLVSTRVGKSGPCKKP